MSTIHDLPLEEGREVCLGGTLLYELLVGHRIFEGLSDDEEPAQLSESSHVSRPGK